MARVACEVSLAKYWVLMFNLLFVIAGLGLLLFGIYDRFESEEYHDEFGDLNWLSGPYLLMIIGGFIFMIAFFGCCGALNENACMILIFTAVLALIILIEMVIGIAALTKRGQIEEKITDRLNTTLYDYEKYQGSWKWIQTEFKCCGITGPRDWLLVFENSTLPEGCCKVDTPDIGCTQEHEGGVFESGCLPEITEYLESKVSMIGFSVIGLALFQIVCLGFSLILYKAF